MKFNNLQILFSLKSGVGGIRTVVKSRINLSQGMFWSFQINYQEVRISAFKTFSIITSFFRH